MKILACTFVVKVGRPLRNAEEMIRIMTEQSADVYLFPAYCLTGATCSNAVNFNGFAELTNQALDSLCEFTETEHKCLVTAVAGNENHDRISVVCHSEILRHDRRQEGFDFFFRRRERCGRVAVADGYERISVYPERHHRVLRGRVKK